jgi:hypothetical protein
MIDFRNWILLEMGYGRFEAPEGVDLMVKGVPCPKVGFADAQIERWPQMTPQDKQLKLRFQQFAGNPGHPFYGHVDNGFLFFIPASYTVRFSTTPPIEPEFQMPPFWLDHLLLTDADNVTLYDSGRKPPQIKQPMQLP